MDRSQFPLLFAYLEGTPKRERRLGQVEEAISTLSAALSAGEIRNVVYQEVKEHLGRIAQDVWNHYVSDAFFWAGKYEEQPEEVQKLQSGILIMSLHDLVSTSKKVSRSEAQGPAMDAMRAVVKELLPLAEAVKGLKEKVVKGRVMRETPAPTNPDKIVKTCACCMRPIAVANSTMAHHGYKRPGSGVQTASCDGIRFPPLEVSPAGLDHSILINQKEVELYREALRNLPGRKTIWIPKPHAPGVRNQELEKITPEDPRWRQQYYALKYSFERDLERSEKVVTFLKKRRAAWLPETPRDPRLVPWFGEVVPASIQAPAPARAPGEGKSEIASPDAPDDPSVDDDTPSRPRDRHSS